MKYKPEDLKNKALFLLKLKEQNDIRYMEFCLRLMSRLNVPMNIVETMIENYSEGKI